MKGFLERKRQEILYGKPFLDMCYLILFEFLLGNIAFADDERE
jgi:hypothetical protein